MSAEPDVVVIGAGPAGSLAAREVATRGSSVLLVDKSSFPRPKVCGCCINAHALGVLDQVGLGELVGEAGAVPLTGMELITSGRRATLDLPGSVALSRTRLDAALVEAATDRGAELVQDTTAIDVGVEGDRRRVLLRSSGPDREVRPRVVIVATGLGGRSSSADEVEIAPDARIGAGLVVDGAPAGYEPGRVVMACQREGYVGLVRLEDGRLDVACALDASAVRAAQGVGPLVTHVLAEAQLPPIPALAGASWQGTPTLSRRARSLASHRTFRIGDAASFVEPFTGQGIAWALASGAAVADVAVRAALAWSPAAEREWELVYRRTVSRRQWECTALRQVLRRPRLVATMTRMLARAPRLARPFVRRIHRPARVPAERSVR